MARSLERSVRFLRPGGYILNMLLFLAAVGAVAFYLSPFSPNPSDVLNTAFMANPALNGLILGVLLIGVIYNLRQAGVVSPAIDWVEAFRETVDPRRARLPRPPLLISAMANILVDVDVRGGRLTAESTRAILDSIGTRMDESREMGRYVGHLLVFLGLLGTFWGLIETVNGVGATISGLTVSGANTEDAIAQLITNLQTPLSGMGIAFSSSLFGLSGSLIVGFLELQASQAQGRFYTDLEDWLSQWVTDKSHVATASSARYDGDVIEAIKGLEAALAVNVEALAKTEAAQTRELREEIRALNKTMIRIAGGE
jgi:hypothetical protein